MLKIWICHSRIQLAGVTGSGAWVRPWTGRSWLLVMVCWCFAKSPAWDFKFLSHSLKPLSSTAWGSVLCVPSLFPCPVCPQWKTSHSCQKDISKITKEELCQAGTSMHVCESCRVSLASWILLSQMSSHRVHAGKPLPGAERCPATFLFPPVHGQLGKDSESSFFWGVLLRASPWAHGRRGWWLHLWQRLPWGLSGSEQGTGWAHHLLSKDGVPEDGGQWEFASTESEESEKASLQWGSEPEVGVRARPEIEQPELEAVLWPSPSERSFP